MPSKVVKPFELLFRALWHWFFINCAINNNLILVNSCYHVLLCLIKVYTLIDSVLGETKHYFHQTLLNVLIYAIDLELFEENFRLYLRKYKNRIANYDGKLIYNHMQFLL